MEHIIQIGVTVDDRRIEDEVVKSAKKELVNDLKEHLYTGNSYYKGLSKDTSDIVREALDKWKPEIIQAAAEIVADSIKRSKAYKEKVKEITNAV